MAGPVEIGETRTGDSIHPTRTANNGYRNSAPGSCILEPWHPVVLVTKTHVKTQVRPHVPLIFEKEAELALANVSIGVLAFFNFFVGRAAGGIEPLIHLIQRTGEIYQQILGAHLVVADARNVCG